MSGPPRLPGSQHFNKVLGGSQCLLSKDVPWETMQFIPGCPFCFQMHSTHRWSRVSVEPHSAPLMILPIHKKPSSMTCVMSWQKWICPIHRALPRQWVTCGLTDTLPGRHENAKSLPWFFLVPHQTYRKHLYSSQSNDCTPQIAENIALLYVIQQPWKHRFVCTFLPTPAAELEYQSLPRQLKKISPGRQT